MGEYSNKAFSKFSLFSLLFVIRETCVGSCPTGMYYGNNGLCYLFNIDKNGLNWMDASSYCKNNGGNLLSIVDYGEYRLLAKYLSHFSLYEYFYIGLNDIQSEGYFVWSDNQIASSFFWDQNEPGGGRGENCVIIYARQLGDLLFGDVDCSRLFNFVCKFKDYCFNIQCSANAECINLINGYTCRCLSGFKTSNGFIEQLGDQCQDINECALSEANICSNKTVCNNFAGGYSCTCKCGFKNNNTGIELLLDTCQVTFVGSCPNIMLKINELKFCYLFKTYYYKLNWTDANSYCKTNGGNLLSIAHAQEFYDLEPYLKYYSGQPFYIGFNDINSEGQFSWSDNETARYYFWASGEPNGGTRENCIVIMYIQADPIIYDVECKALNGYVCKFQDYCDKHNCSTNALCNIVVDGFTCTCKYGFKTTNGGIEQFGDQCQDINECALPITNYCSINSICNNYDGGYNCKCKCGFKTNNGGDELYNDKCQVENCVLSNISSNYSNVFIGKKQIYVNITTSCWCALQNVSIYLEPEPLLIFKGFVWDNSSVNDSNVQSNGKVSIIHVDYLSKTKYAFFSAIFVFDKNIPMGKTNMLVNVHYTWFFTQEFFLKSAWKMISLSVEGLILLQDPVYKMTPTWTYNKPNGTSLYTKTHEFVCMALQKRQPSKCYQRELSTGIITFLPVQVLEVIGYDTNTTLIYGRTTRNNFIEVNIKTRKLNVIKNEECLKIKACNLKKD